MPVFCDVNGGLSLLDGDFGGDITLRCDTAERGLPACRLTAYSADRIEFKALRCCRIPAQAFSAPRKKAARGRLFCCVRVRFC